MAKIKLYGFSWFRAAVHHPTGDKVNPRTHPTSRIVGHEYLTLPHAREPRLAYRDTRLICQDARFRYESGRNAQRPSRDGTLSRVSRSLLEL